MSSSLCILKGHCRHKDLTRFLFEKSTYVIPAHAGISESLLFINMVFGSAAAEWEIQESGVDPELSDLSFADADTGWVVGGDTDMWWYITNAILVTHDRGQTWTNQLKERSLTGGELI